MKEIQLLSIARLPHEHEMGLRFVRSIPDMSGMLFQFNTEKVLNFWMAETYIPLDIAFVSKGHIVKIERMIPLSTRTVSSGKPCSMALETNAGVLCDIPIGTKVLLSEDETRVLLDDDDDS